MIGQTITLGWNGAKLFADRGVLDCCTVTIEAVGKDWVIVRYDGKSYGAGGLPFNSTNPITAKGLKKLLKE